MLDGLIDLIWAILVVLAVLALAYVFTRFLVGRTSGGTIRYRGRRITVLEQATVGKDQKLLLVQMGEQFYFLGSTPGGITCLEQVSPEESQRWKLEDEARSGQQPPSFQEALRKVGERWTNRGGS